MTRLLGITIAVISAALIYVMWADGAVYIESDDTGNIAYGYYGDTESRMKELQKRIDALELRVKKLEELWEEHSSCICLEEGEEYDEHAPIESNGITPLDNSDISTDSQELEDIYGDSLGGRVIPLGYDGRDKPQVDPDGTLHLWQEDSFRHNPPDQCRGLCGGEAFWNGTECLCPDGGKR